MRRWGMKLYKIQNMCGHDITGENFYVYELIDPNTQQSFYVGKGRYDRGWKHMILRNGVTYIAQNPHRAYKIRSIINRGDQVLVNIVSSHISQKDAYASEQCLIEQYGRMSNNTGILTNITQGGEGNTSDGKPVSQYNMYGELIRTYKNAKMAAWMNGWNHYSTICGCCRGREISYKGFLWAYEGSSPNLRSKMRPVYKWSLDGEFICRYPSASEATRDHQCDYSNIPNCARGKTKTAVGYRWSYTKKLPVQLEHKKIKKVLCVTTGELYPSVTSAANALGKSVGDMSRYCNGTLKHSKGMLFQYLI
jgi:hypothetical protein